RDRLDGKKPRGRPGPGFCPEFCAALFGGRAGVLVLPGPIALAGPSVLRLSPLATQPGGLVAMALAGRRSWIAAGAVAGPKTNRTRATGRAALLCRHAVSLAGLPERLWHALFVRLGPLGLLAQSGAADAGCRADRTG